MAGAAINGGSTAPAQAPVPGISLPHSIAYQVGSAARIEVTEAGGVISIISATPATGWSVVSTSGAGPTATVVLTDGTQNVTFIASMLNGTVHTDVSSTLAPAPAIAAVPPVVVVQEPSTQAPSPTSAQPPAAAPATNAPVGAAATTSPSKSGAQVTSGTSHHNDDDNESDDEGGDSNDD
jgi:hypothetical protein